MEANFINATFASFLSRYGHFPPDIHNLQTPSLSAIPPLNPWSGIHMLAAH